MTANKEQMQSEAVKYLTTADGLIGSAKKCCQSVAVSDSVFSESYRAVAHYTAQNIESVLAENQRLRAEVEAHRWIPVGERLPDDYSQCLCYCEAAEEPEGKIQFGFVEGGLWRMHARYGSFQFDGVTRWQPIIAPEVNGE